MEKTHGECFVEELKNGEFKKNYRPNHGPDFTGGLEGLHLHFFKAYMSSCGCFLMDQRLVREEYHG
jgi:hypothetical protein